MNIGLDVDGVLTDFEWFLDFYAQKMFGTKFKSDIEQYKFADRFYCSSKDEVMFYARYLWRYIHKIPICEGAAAVIKALRQQGNKIYIITARALASSNKNPISLMMRNILKKWLKKNGVEYDEILFVGSSNSAKEKCALAKCLKLDYFIEDDPHNIRDLARITNVICITANYNLNIPNVQYALDFGEVFHIISTNDKISIVPFEERNKMPRDKRAEYFEKLKRYYSAVPSDKTALKSYRKSFEETAKLFGTLFRCVIKRKLIFEDNARFMDNAIYICNHRRALDIPLALYTLKNQTPRLLLKKELKGTLSGKILSKIGAVYVDRGSSISGKRAQNALIKTVLDGGSILIFPEGTRNKTEQPLLPFRYGALHIAQITGAPIVPIVMTRINKRRFKIRVAPPLYIDKGDILEPKMIKVQQMVLDMLV